MGLWTIATAEPERTAVIEPGGQAISYRELAARADRYGWGPQPERLQASAVLVRAAGQLGVADGPAARLDHRDPSGLRRRNGPQADVGHGANLVQK